MTDSKAISDALGTPFPQSAIQTHPQTRMKYVEGHTYIHRLNDATGNAWDWKIVRQDFHPYGATAKGNARLLITVIGELTIPGLGTRAGMGVQVVTADTGGEDMWKGAMTDAIKAAAKLFGVGLELYGPDYEAGEVTGRVVDAPIELQQQLQRQRQTTPRNAGATQTNATAKQAQDDTFERCSRGQLNVIDNHRKKLGWTEDDITALVKAKDVEAVEMLSTEQAMSLIHFLADEPKATAYMSKQIAKQTQLIPNTDTAERARN